jgi:hypothetical protein
MTCSFVDGYILEEPCASIFNFQLHLKMQAAASSVMLVPINKTTWWHIPEDEMLQLINVSLYSIWLLVHTVWYQAHLKAECFIIWHFKICITSLLWNRTIQNFHRSFYRLWKCWTEYQDGTVYEGSQNVYYQSHFTFLVVLMLPWRYNILLGVLFLLHHMMPYTPLLKVNQRFGGRYCLHLWGRRISRAKKKAAWKQVASLIGWLSADYTALHPRTSNPTNVLWIKINP